VSDLTSYSHLKQMLRQVTILKELSRIDEYNYIARLLDFYWAQAASDSYYALIVMEFVEGRTLKNFIEDANNKTLELSSEMVNKIIFNLLSAVNFIHQANVLHRDIKPDNIIINDNLEITLVDFGLARTSPDPEAIKELAKETPISKKDKKAMGNMLNDQREERKSRRRDLSPHI